MVGRSTMYKHMQQMDDSTTRPLTFHAWSIKPWKFGIIRCDGVYEANVLHGLKGALVGVLFSPNPSSSDQPPVN